MRARGSILLAAVLLVVGPPRSVGAEEPRRAFEASLALGYGHVVVPSFAQEREVSSQNGGLSWAVAGAYRSRYLFIPWLEIGGAELYGNVERAREAPNGESRSSLSTLYLALGPSVALGPTRLRAGMGFFRMDVSSSFGGHTITPSEYDLGYLASYRIYALNGRRFSGGLDFSALLISEAQVPFVGLSLLGAVNLGVVR